MCIRDSPEGRPAGPHLLRGHASTARPGAPVPQAAPGGPPRRAVRRARPGRRLGARGPHPGAALRRHHAGPRHASHRTGASALHGPIASGTGTIDRRMRRPGLLASTWVLFRKDLLVEWRSRARVNALVFFSLATLLLFSFALGPDTALLRRNAGGYLWLALLLSSVLALGESFRVERENSSMEGPVSYTHLTLPTSNLV